jgi:hypothetical protein
MQKGTQEHCIMINFDFSLYPAVPLGTPELLANPEFPIPVSFAYGAQDWTRVVDDDFAKTHVVPVNPFKEESRFHIVPDSDHNMHMDNPNALAAVIINDLLNLEGDDMLLVLPLAEQAAPNENAEVFTEMRNAFTEHEDPEEGQMGVQPKDIKASMDLTGLQKGEEEKKEEEK